MGRGEHVYGGNRKKDQEEIKEEERTRSGREREEYTWSRPTSFKPEL